MTAALLLAAALAQALPSVAYTIKVGSRAWTVEARLRDLPEGAVGRLEPWSGWPEAAREHRLDGLPVLTYTIEPVRDRPGEPVRNARAPWCAEDHCGAFAANTLLRVFHQGRPIRARRTLSFELPFGWTAQTGWGPPAGGVVTLDESFDNGLYAFGRKPAAADYFGKGLVVQHGLDSDVTPKLGRVAGSLLNRYGTLFGVMPARPSVIFAFGRESGHGTRTAHGIAVNIREPAFADSPACAEFIGHELLHDWLGGLLRAVPDSEHVWFQEGFTEYLSARALRDAGLDDGGLLAAKMAEAHAFVEASPENEGAVPLRAGYDWRANEERHLLGYRKGLLLGAGLDAALRPRGGLAFMIADLLRGGPTVDNARIERWLDDNGLSAFSRDWLKTSRVPPLDGLLRDLGAGRK